MWPPAVAWDATLSEVFLALDGYRDANTPSSTVRPMSKSEAADLAFKYGGTSFSISRKVKGGPTAEAVRAARARESRPPPK